MSTGIGIDYGMGQTNIDYKTGIRYGVIPTHDVDCWGEESKPNYGKPTCPECGNPISDDVCTDRCENCDKQWESEDLCPEEPLSWYVDDGEYCAEQSKYDSDIFIMKSPFYTKAVFCSPCAPGACHLSYPHPNGEKAYCFGPSWFDGEKTPYPVYRVSNDSLIQPSC